MSLQCFHNFTWPLKTWCFLLLLLLLLFCLFLSFCLVGFKLCLNLHSSVRIFFFEFTVTKQNIWIYQRQFKTKKRLASDCWRIFAVNQINQTEIECTDAETNVPKCFLDSVCYCFIFFIFYGLGRGEDV